MCTREALCVERFVPLRAEHPCQCRHPATNQPPLEVIPAKILLAVLLLDSRSGFLGSLEDLLLRLVQQLIASLDPVTPILVSIPPDLVPQLVIGRQDSLVVAPQQQRKHLPRILVIGDPLDLVTILRVTNPMPVGSHCFRVSRIGRLRLGPSSLAETYVLASELAVQLF